jgi:hypothetical protein
MLYTRAPSVVAQFLLITNAHNPGEPVVTSGGLFALAQRARVLLQQSYALPLRVVRLDPSPEHDALPSPPLPRLRLLPILPV